MRDKEKKRKADKKYSEKHKQEKKEYDRNRYIKNREEKLNYQKQYTEEHKKEIREYDKKYREKNWNELLKKKKEYDRNRRKYDINYRIRSSIRANLNFYIKKNKQIKSISSSEINIMLIRKYIENQFDENMNWNNYGTYWQIDHIIPQSLFDFTDKNEILKCWNAKNLRPIKKEENQIKSNKLDFKLIEEYNIKHLLPNGVNIG